MTSTSKISKESTSILSNLNNFHLLEVVDRVSNIALRRFLYNHVNIVTEGGPKSGICPTLSVFTVHSITDSTAHYIHLSSLDHCVYHLHLSSCLLPADYWISRICAMSSEPPSSLDNSGGPNNLT